MQVLYPGRIGIIWGVGFWGGRKTVKTQRKTLGAPREPTASSTHK